MSRSVGSLLELSGDEVRALALATLGPTPVASPLARRVVAVLAFGAGDPPPAAWIAAASRLGAGVFRESDLAASPDDAFAAAAEAARWADVIVVEHPLTGFARAVARMTGKPVVNGGETSGECPAAAIALLADAWADGLAAPGRRLRAAVCGDLAGSRRARSFLAALAAVDATVLLVPARGGELGADDVQRLARRVGRDPLRFEAEALRSILDMVDTVLLGPEASPQLPLFEEVGVPPDEQARRVRREVEDLDVLLFASSGGDRLVREPFRGTASRLPPGAEPRVPLRALEALLEFAAVPAAAPAADVAPDAPGRYASALGLTCKGESCVACRHPDAAPPDFAAVGRGHETLECLYCGARVRARFAASKLERRFHPLASPDTSRILPANLVLFRTRGEALASGFEPARRRLRDDGEA